MALQADRASSKIFRRICSSAARVMYWRRRRDYIVVDRHKLSYLNGIEKLNCVYCGDANGVFAYTREITAPDRDLLVPHDYFCWIVLMCETSAAIRPLTRASDGSSA